MAGVGLSKQKGTHSALPARYRSIPKKNSKKSLDPVFSYRVYDGTMKAKDNPKLTRAVVARMAGVGLETLRFYEQKGLLEEPERNEAGYRIYTPEALERLAFIARAQDLGFSLTDIRQLLDLTGDIRTPRKKVRDFAKARLEIIRKKIRDLKAMEKTLTKLLDRCDGQGALQGCPIAEFIGGHCHE